jgi:ComF family protein
MILLDRLLKIVAPLPCLLCDVEFFAGEIVCGSCELQLKICSTSPTSDQTLDACYVYDGSTRRLLWALKNESVVAVASFMGSRVAQKIMADYNSNGYAVAYVPTLMKKVQQRGFDHAKTIAQVAAKSAGLTVSHCLLRIAKGEQKSKSRHERLEFAKKTNFIIVGTVPSRIILIDDVCTTGATLRSAEFALKSAGCREVITVAFAKKIS